MIDIKLEVSPGIKKLLNPDKRHLEVAIKKSCDDLGQKINNKIKEPGFVPRDTGQLANSHYVVSNNEATFIVSNRRTSTGVPLWIYITNGHKRVKTLTTPKSRRWWFWYLHNVLGGEYTPKPGKEVFVKPNRYHERAVAAVSMETVSSIIKQELLK